MTDKSDNKKIAEEGAANASQRNEGKPSGAQQSAKPDTSSAQAKGDTGKKGGDNAKAAEAAKGGDKSSAKSKGEEKPASAAKGGDKPSADMPPVKKESTPPPQVAAAKTQRKGSPMATFFSFLALVFGIGAGGGVVWVWQQFQMNHEQSLAKIEAQAEQTTSAIEDVRSQVKTEVSDAMAQLDTTKQSMTAEQQQALEKLAVTEKKADRNEKAQEALQASLEGLYQRIGNTSREWMVLEADYLLQIGNHRLQLERDLNTAMSALQLADERIRAIGDPALLEVREAIASEITSLETFNVPDRAGISLSIAKLSETVEKLPLIAQVQPENLVAPSAETEPFQADSWSDLPMAIWTAIKELVTVRFNDRPVEALLPPEQVSFLYQNLRLKLEQARLAVMQQDTKLYKDNLAMAEDWIKNYFNMESGEVQNVVAKLGTLQHVEIHPTMPDISTSLRVLRNVAARLNIDGGRLGAASTAEFNAEVASTEGGE